MEDNKYLKLDYIIDENKKCVVNTTLPNFLELRSSVKGYAVYTLKKILKDEVLCTIKSILLHKDEFQEIEFNIDNRKYPFVLGIHGIPLDDGSFAITAFDEFMNHSCSNNIKCELENDGITYKIIAIKDIEEGHEITSNYNLFYYDLHDKGFRCLCGSTDCFNFIRGYKYLNEKERESIESKIDIEHKRYFLELDQENNGNKTRTE